MTAFGLAIGAAVAIGLWYATRSTFDRDVFAATNYRGRTVPVGAGVLIAVTVIVVEGATSRVTSLGPWRGQVLLAALGFGLLGLFDDVGGGSGRQGFRGHISAALAGRVTTGALKLAGGALLALAIAAPSQPLGWWIVDAAVIALGANMANLLDRAPARATKVAVVAFIALIVVGDDLWPVAVVMGAALGLAVFELREELMLGDAGSNVVGAAMAVGAVVTLGRGATIAVLAVLLCLTAVSEWISFSSVISRTPPLRWLDELGRGGAGRASPGDSVE